MTFRDHSLPPSSEQGATPSEASPRHRRPHRRLSQRQSRVAVIHPDPWEWQQALFYPIHFVIDRPFEGRVMCIEASHLVLDALDCCHAVAAGTAAAVMHEPPPHVFHTLAGLIGPPLFV